MWWHVCPDNKFKPMSLKHGWMIAGAASHFKERTTAAYVLSLWSKQWELWAACVASPQERESMGLMHELGGFFNQFGKCRGIFQEIAKSEHCFISLKPLCATRWTVRTPAICSVLSQYKSVLTALEETASCSSSDTSTKANVTFLKENTALACIMAEDLMGDLECLNTSLQFRKQTV